MVIKEYIMSLINLLMKWQDQQHQQPFKRHWWAEQITLGKLEMHTKLHIHTLMTLRLLT